MKKNTLAVIAFLFSLLACNVQAADAPDLSGFWTVRFEQSPSGTQLFEKLPEDAVYINDAGGGELSEGDYGGLKITERARDEIRNYDFDVEFSVAYTCMPPTAVFYMQAPFPMEIHQGRDIIVFTMEYFDMVRIIFMDGREHPGDELPHSKNDIPLAIGKVMNWS